MNRLNKIFRLLIPYTPGEQPQGKGFIKLNTNENPFPPPEKILREIRKSINSSLRLYPDPQASELRKIIARLYGFSDEWVFIGNGSDEILRLCITAFSSSGEKIVFPYPSYPLYETLSIIADRKPLKIPLKKDFSIPANFISKFKNCVKIVANPDSPSGVFHPVDFIESAVRNNNKVVIVDEAYVDFAKENCLVLVKKYPNVIVSRSFSKSFSLAGIRLGYCFGNPDLISALFSIKDSYNVDMISQQAGIVAMKNYCYMIKNCRKIVELREFLTSHLEKLGFYVFPSSGNFLLVAPPDGDGLSLYRHLKENRILVRYFGGIPELRNFVRITIGDRRSILFLLKIIKKFYGYK